MSRGLRIRCYFNYLKYLFKRPSRPRPWRASSQKSNQKAFIYAVLRAIGVDFAHRLPTRNFCPQIVVASVLWSYYILFCRIMQEIVI